jgi:hypothetical protein
MEPNILIEELACGEEILPKLVEGISQVAAQLKPDVKTRSILEVVGHLYDEEREDFRVRLEIMLTRPNDPWPPIHPEEWVTERAYNEQDLVTVVRRFVEERQNSLMWLRKLENPAWDATVTSPFGSMRPGDMLASWVAHDNLHMRQLVELRRWRIEQITAPFDLRYAGDW